MAMGRSNRERQRDLWLVGGVASGLEGFAETSGCSGAARFAQVKTQVEGADVHEHSISGSSWAGDRGVSFGERHAGASRRDVWGLCTYL